MSVGLFDILGPITVGPSSSHTAGAVRIGLACRTILKEEVKRAAIVFYGSFANTYKGHGTDKAVVAGLLGLNTFDPEVRNALAIAEDRKLQYVISTAENPRYHPNTVVIRAESEHKSVAIRGISVGGGQIELVEINGFAVSVRCNADTLIIFGKDVKGVFLSIAEVLKNSGYNIATLYLDREGRAGNTVIVIETDTTVDEETVAAIQRAPNILGVVPIAKF